ncbi:Zinc knuckle family protein [Aphelenchoides avenae]|nr:Zinc knuckle family protein [Aphelenchus avenae]
MKPKTTDACGDSRLLPARRGLKPTDRCSNNDESTQFDQQAEADGTDNSDAAADRHELRDEEDTSSESSGDYSDYSSSTSENPPDSTPLPTDAIYCASSTTEPTTLLECIKATAENPTKDVSREVLIFFDSGSNRSFVTTELARDLSLPRDPPCSLRVSTFGNELPATIEGFSTSIVLRSKHRRLQPLAIIAGDCIVPSVRTALIDPTDLNKLRRSELSPSPIQVTPDILIGQDLVSHFKRRHGPTLPSGFYVVHSILGPMLGGSATQPQVPAPQVRPALAVGILTGPMRRLLLQRCQH